MEGVTDCRPQQQGFVPDGNNGPGAVLDGEQLGKAQRGRQLVPGGKPHGGASFSPFIEPSTTHPRNPSIARLGICLAGRVPAVAAHARYGAERPPAAPGGKRGHELRPRRASRHAPCLPWPEAFLTLPEKCHRAAEPER